MANSQARR
ncbi:hypothetical protein YPPY12_4216, partial [Yersinia pestis PY-12]